jgi:hypothetical protein
MQSISLSFANKPVELHGINRKGNVSLSEAITTVGDYNLDVNKWLPAAAEKYNISPDLNDYILIPVPSIVTELPNTNGDSASYSELVEFNPEQGRLVYETWKGKPTYEEHKNNDIRQAKGVILDTMLKPLKQYGGNHYKLIKLLAYDRTRDAKLCNDILRGEINTYSMGMLFKYFTCSICGHVVHTPKDPMCAHTNPRRKTYMLANGQLVFRRCSKITGFECSAVRDPAFVSANSDVILDVRRFNNGDNPLVANKNTVI